MIDQMYNMFKYVIVKLIWFFVPTAVLLMVALVVSGYYFGTTQELRNRIDKNDTMFIDMYSIIEEGQNHRKQLETEGAFNARVKKGKNGKKNTKTHTN